MAPPRSQPRRHGNTDAARMRMDSYRGHSNNPRSTRGFRRNNLIRNRRVAESPRRRELIQHARRDTQSSYWTKRLLEVEEKEPNRWRHTGFKEMYRDELKGGSSPSGSKSRSSHSRSPIARPKSPVERRPRSPPVRQDRNRPRPRSPPSPPSKRHVSRGRPRTPKRSCSRHRSESVSSSESISSCSDDSCSVCSPKPKSRARSPSPKSPPRKKQAPRKISNPPVTKRSHRKSPPIINNRKKRCGPKSPPQPHTPDSTSESSSSSSESETSSEDNSEQQKLSLSERFGKMAQWSVDRKEYDSIKMKITKDDSAPGMKVVIENDAEFPQFERPAVVQSASPERDYAFHYERRRYFFERTFTHDRPTAAGTDAPLNWEDPVNRYTYYKTKGLLWETDVSFDEYIKWENWWERFQEWLDVEKTYYGEDTALDNARRERERDWESYRTSNMGRTMFDRELLPLPRNQPWNRTSVRGRIGPRRKFV